MLRQPFGGMGLSAIGAGIKAGGPNYVQQFCRITAHQAPQTGEILKSTRMLSLTRRWETMLKKGLWEEQFGREVTPELLFSLRAWRSALDWQDREFGREHEYFHLRGQDNLFRYLPVDRYVVRLHEQDSLSDPQLCSLTARHQCRSCITPRQGRVAHQSITHSHQRSQLDHPPI